MSQWAVFLHAAGLFCGLPVGTGREEGALSVSAAADAAHVPVLFQARCRNAERSAAGRTGDSRRAQDAGAAARPPCAAPPLTRQPC